MRERVIDRYFPQDSAFVIAEIGTSHRGDIGRARTLIDAAAEAGADCVKTQIVYAEEIVHPLTGTVDLPGGPVPLYERFRALEVQPELFADMAEHCRRRGLVFLASAFGERSLADLVALGCDAVKIASPELNHAPLLRAAADAGLAAVLSTGVSTLADIERALGIVDGNRSGVLHCVTAYPAPEEEYNLRVIANLANTFGVPAGISDHSQDPVLVPGAAVALGARAVEKHLTLSRGDGGLDDPIALEPGDFAVMVEWIRAAADRPAEESRAELVARYGTERMERVLGDGVKRLAPAEAGNYGRSNRSIIATADIAAGEPVGTHNAAILRSEKNLEPGLSPFHWADIDGARAAAAIPDGTGIRWQHLLARDTGRAEAEESAQ